MQNQKLRGNTSPKIIILLDTLEYLTIIIIIGLDTFEYLIYYCNLKEDMNTSLNPR